MANSVGGIIEDVDYNSIRNKVIAVLGAGSGNSGLPAQDIFLSRR